PYHNTHSRHRIIDLFPRAPITSFSRVYDYSLCVSFFFFNATPTTEIYTLSLHDALPISMDRGQQEEPDTGGSAHPVHEMGGTAGDRKSTRLNSSHQIISYAVFCLKKKKKKTQT